MAALHARWKFGPQAHHRSLCIRVLVAPSLYFPPSSSSSDIQSNCTLKSTCFTGSPSISVLSSTFSRLNLRLALATFGFQPSVPSGLRASQTGRKRFLRNVGNPLVMDICMYLGEGSTMRTACTLAEKKLTSTVWVALPRPHNDHPTSL